MNEKTFKTHLLYLLLGSKMLIALYAIFFLFSGISLSERTMVIALSLPLLAAYLVPLWKDVFKPDIPLPGTNKKKKKKATPLLSEPVPIHKYRIAIGAFVLYTIVIMVVLTIFLTGSMFPNEADAFSDSSLNRSGILAGWISGIESLFGLYLGPVITSLVGRWRVVV